MEFLIEVAISAEKAARLVVRQTVVDLGKHYTRSEEVVLGALLVVVLEARRGAAVQRMVQPAGRQRVLEAALLGALLGAVVGVQLRALIGVQLVEEGRRAGQENE